MHSPAVAPLPPTLAWEGGESGSLLLLDQTRLPGEVVYIDCRDVQTVWDGIKRLSVRGAPFWPVSSCFFKFSGPGRFSTPFHFRHVVLVA